MTLKEKRKELRSTAFKTIADCLREVEKQDKECFKEILEEIEVILTSASIGKIDEKISLKKINSEIQTMIKQKGDLG